MDADHPKEHKEESVAAQAAEQPLSDVPKGKEKKKKIRPYHRIHAHRNPLSDSPMQ